MWQSMRNAVLEALYKWACWIVKLLVEFAEQVLGLIQPFFPSWAASSIESLVPYIKLANAWVPIDLACSLAAGYYILWGAGVAIRWCFKLIPTMG